MNIVKALKTKNLLVKEISQLQNKISSYNSTLVGAAVPYDTKALLTQLGGKVNELVALKTAINKANLGIQGTIYELGEKKSFVSRIRSINTTSGKVSSGRFSETPRVNEYVAQITILELDSMVATLEKEIDDLQEKIDTYNYTTQVTI